MFRVSAKKKKLAQSYRVIGQTVSILLCKNNHQFINTFSFLPRNPPPKKIAKVKLDKKC